MPPLVFLRWGCVPGLTKITIDILKIRKLQKNFGKNYFQNVENFPTSNLELSISCCTFTL